VATRRGHRRGSTTSLICSICLYEPGLAADILHGQAASRSTATAALGTDSAMCVALCVPLTFFRADRAGMRTHVEHLYQDSSIASGSPRCQGAGGKTNIGAIQIQPDALPQLARCRLGSARIGTSQARQHTVVAFFDASDEGAAVLAPRFRVRLDDLPHMHLSPLSLVGMTMESCVTRDVFPAPPGACSAVSR
jgi:hypothetical protein